MGDKYNFKNIQIGNNNNMYNNTYESKSEILQEKHWEELESFLDKRLKELKYDSENYKIAKESLEYSKQRNEKGLREFIKSNKETFVTNVLSDAASSGLLFVLGKMFL